MQLWGPWGAQSGALAGPGISKWHEGNCVFRLTDPVGWPRTQLSTQLDSDWAAQPDWCTSIHVWLRQTQSQNIRRVQLHMEKSDSAGRDHVGSQWKLPRRYSSRLPQSSPNSKPRFNLTVSSAGSPFFTFSPPFFNHFIYFTYLFMVRILSSTLLVYIIIIKIML